MGDLKTESFRHLVPYRNRLDSIGMLQMEINDLHALKFVQAAFTIRDELNLCCALVPVVSNRREPIRENPTVGGIRSTVSEKKQSNLVGNGSLQ